MLTIEATRKFIRGNTKMSHLTKCPICNSESQSVYSLNADFIRTQLQLYYNEPPPEQLGLLDYEILRCGNCTLEYAMPLQAGSESFYHWITNHPGYYPNERWEWFNVIDRIKTNHYDSINVLEIGCGSGKFIEMARQVPNLRVVGLDTTITSVDHCRNKGLEVYCETIESFLCNSSNQKQRFDFVVAFHCLEHVGNPKEFVASMLSLLKPTGKIVVSTPY
jgi:2-polyprenyl-3-methyl-5-hydroxy-6-metoxy-1,4-benzoquinol methylase